MRVPPLTESIDQILREARVPRVEVDERNEELRKLAAELRTYAPSGPSMDDVYRVKAALHG